MPAAVSDSGYNALQSPRRPPLQLIGGNHEAFDGLTGDQSIHDLRDIRDRDASVKEMIGFD